MKTNQILIGAFFIICSLLFSSCNETKELIESLPDGTEEEVEGSTESLEPLQRIYRCYMDNGVFTVSPTHVEDGTIENKNVHVITHGWAPGYRSAVTKYARDHNGATLLAWQPEAIAGGERFFVGSFFPLAESILKADPESAVLIFSWIDISASDISFLKFLEGEAYDQFCHVEKQTPLVATMLREAVDSALKPGVPHELHLLGHSFGTKVVSIGAVELKEKNYLDRIHLTLFDSPENAPVDCGDNRLCDVLESFEPDRDKYFVDNYISYWDKCFSDCHDSGDQLHLVVDATILPYRDSCAYMEYQNCASCKHSAGVNWYTVATNDAAHDSGLWWSPLMGNLRVTGSLQRYYIKPYDQRVTISPSPTCGQAKITTCKVP